MLATYLPAFFVSGALCVIAAVLALVIVRPGATATAAPNLAPAKA
jgi:hypothetical protein